MELMFMTLRLLTVIYSFFASLSQPISMNALL